MLQNRYCMYLRKSRSDIEAEARGEGETLARHKKILMDLASKMNLNVFHIYEEIVSGESITARPAMQKLLSEVEENLWAGVLVVEIERLARGDTVDQGIVAQSFKYSHTKIITPLKVYDPLNEYDEEYFEFGLFMSRREYKTINRRLQRGRLQSVQEGKYLGNVAPYGYERIKLTAEKGYSLKVIPEHAKVVELIFNLYVYGLGHASETRKTLGPCLIADRLNTLCIASPKGALWSSSTIRTILTNPVYTGKVRWKARPREKRIVHGHLISSRPRAHDEDVLLVEGLHDSIIDSSLFQKAQDIRKKKQSAPIPKIHILKNPLAGLIECGLCGKKMVRRPYKNAPDTLLCKTHNCPNVSSNLPLIEARIIESLEKWLSNYILDFSKTDASLVPHNIQKSLLDNAHSKLDRNIMTLNNQLSSLHNLLEQGIYTPEIFTERKNTITTQLNQYLSDREYLLSTLLHAYKSSSATNMIKQGSLNMMSLYSHLHDAQTKNLFIKELLSKVKYTKTVNGRWHDHPDQFNLILYPRLPNK